MAAVVEIQVQVNPTDSAAKIDGVSKELDTLGNAGAQAGQRAGAGMQQMGGHVATGLDSVRLLSQEFGLRMPRAIEAMLSRMPGVTSALSSIVGVMAGVAGIEIFSRVVEGAKRAYDEFINLNAMIEKYNENIEKARQADLPNSRSLETTEQRLRTQTQVGAQSHQQAQSTQSQGFQDLGNGMANFNPMRAYRGAAEIYQAHGQGTTANSADVARDALSRKMIDDLHQQAVAQIELNHAQDASLTGAQKINAEAQKKKDITAETRTYQNKVEKSYGNEISPNAGADEQRTKDQTADAEAAAQKTVMGRETSLAIMKANDATAQAQLQGEALYFRKMQDDIRELTVELNNQGKAAEIPAKVREANTKYFDDLSERMVKAQNESGASVRRSSSAGLTGAARIYADQDEQVNKNNTDLAKDPGAQHTANVAAATEANNKLADLQQQFAERMGSIEESRVDSTLNGYQRIAAEAAKTASQITEDFNKSWGGSSVDTGSSQYIAAKKAEQDALTAVQAKAASDSTAFTNKENEETLRYDQQAAEAQRRVKSSGMNGWVSDYQEALAEIQAKEQEQTKQLNDELAKRQISQDAYNQRIKDVDAEANAQVAAQAADMQHKIAGTLESAFKDPVGTIKDIMQKMFFDILSQWISQLGIFKGTFAASLGGMAPGGAHGGGSGGAGGLIQSIAGGSGGGFRAPYTGGAGASVSGAGASSGASMSAAGVSSSGGGFNVGGALSSARNIGGMLNLGGGSSPSAVDSSVAMPSASDDTGIATIDTPSTGNVSGTPDDYSTPAMSFGGGASTAMGIAGAAGGLYTGEQATVSAFEKGQPLQGAMADAAAGAAIGSIVPGIGTAIGAGIGAAVGLASGALGLVTGMAGRMGARDYYNKSIFPQIDADGAAADYASGISDADRAASSGMNYMVQHFGQDAANWVKSNYMDKELAYVIGRITNRAKGGSGYEGASAAQFHSGGYIDGFGSLGTSSNEGYIHAMAGESVVNKQATSLHAPTINAMNSGASASDVASIYLSGAKSNSSSPSMGSGGDTHYHVHTLDTKTMTGWLRGGGARMISKEQNNMAGQYAGDGVIG